MAVRMSADLLGILRVWIHRHCGIHGSQTQKSIHGAQTNTKPIHIQWMPRPMPRPDTGGGGAHGAGGGRGGAGGRNGGRGGCSGSGGGVDGDGDANNGGVSEANDGGDGEADGGGGDGDGDASSEAREVAA